MSTVPYTTWTGNTVSSSVAVHPASLGECFITSSMSARHSNMLEAKYQFKHNETLKDCLWKQRTHKRTEIGDSVVF